MDPAPRVWALAAQWATRGHGLEVPLKTCRPLWLVVAGGPWGCPTARPHLTLPILPVLCFSRRGAGPGPLGGRYKRFLSARRHLALGRTLALATSLKAQGLVCPSVVNHGLSGCPTLRPAPQVPLRGLPPPGPMQGPDPQAPLQTAGWAPGSPFGGPRASEGSYLISLPKTTHFWGPHSSGGAPGARP